MVRLDRIYTRSGDDGSTGLTDGTRVGKDDPRIEAEGAVDELNVCLGLVRCEVLPPDLEHALPGLQNDCFDLGADIATPIGSPWEQRIPRLRAEQVAALEQLIDASSAKLEPLTSFVLPAGSRAAAQMHLARVCCRRAERCLWRLARHLGGASALNPQALAWVNRLSDLLFVWCRRCNDDGRNDVLWVPGGAPAPA